MSGTETSISILSRVVYCKSFLGTSALSELSIPVLAFACDTCLTFIIGVALDLGRDLRDVLCEFMVGVEGFTALLTDLLLNSLLGRSVCD